MSDEVSGKAPTENDILTSAHCLAATPVMAQPMLLRFGLSFNLRRALFDLVR